MSLMDQFKWAGDLLKNMSPQEVMQLMEQAKQSKKMLEDDIARVVDQEIKKRGLVSRAEVEEMLKRLS